MNKKTTFSINENQTNIKWQEVQKRKLAEGQYRLNMDLDVQDKLRRSKNSNLKNSSMQHQ